MGENEFAIWLPQFIEIRSVERVIGLCQQLSASLKEYQYAVEWQLQVLFQQLLIELASSGHLEKSMPTVSVSEKAAAYLQRNYRHKITYKGLGEALSFHPNHIARCMNQVMGCTPIEYLNQIRLEKAKLFLLSTDWNVEQISERCGFSQGPYFSRLFKKKEGISPIQYRKRYMQ